MDRLAVLISVSEHEGSDIPTGETDMVLIFNLINVAP